MTVEEASIPAGSMAAVSMWHVLEHVEDPGDVLGTVRKWLEPGGTLLVGVPNVESLQARVGGPGWYHLDVPRHRTHFSARGVERLMGSAGFEVVRTEHRLLEHNPFGLWQSVVSQWTPTRSWLYHALKRNARARPADVAPTVLALPLLPIAVAVEAVAGAAGRGGTVAVVARRR